jgi:hypothetical protein
MGIAVSQIPGGGFYVGGIAYDANWQNPGSSVRRAAQAGSASSPPKISVHSPHSSGRTFDPTAKSASPSAPATRRTSIAKAHERPLTPRCHWTSTCRVGATFLNGTPSCSPSKEISRTVSERMHNPVQPTLRDCVSAPTAWPKRDPTGVLLRQRADLLPIGRIVRVIDTHLEAVSTEITSTTPGRELCFLAVVAAPVKSRAPGVLRR